MGTVHFLFPKYRVTNVCASSLNFFAKFRTCLAVLEWFSNKHLWFQMFKRVIHIRNKTIFMDFIGFVFDFNLPDVSKTFPCSWSQEDLSVSCHKTFYHQVCRSFATIGNKKKRACKVRMSEVKLLSFIPHLLSFNPSIINGFKNNIK